MAVQIGIYDFFAYTLPGGLYLLVVILFIEPLAPETAAISLSSLSLIELVALGLAAYFLGLLCTPIAFLFWQTVNRRPNLALKAREKLLRRFPDFELRFKGAEWPVLNARIALASTELAARIDKHRATGIMLRNATPALLALSAAVLLSASLQSQLLLRVIWGVAILVAAYLSNRECTKYMRWSYSLIFEAAIAEALQSSDVVRLKEWSTTNRRRPRGSTKESRMPPHDLREPLDYAETGAAIKV